MGCPARCVFCDQSMFSRPIRPQEIPSLVAGFLSGCRHAAARRRILAFYGGTFTSIDRGLLDEYLAVTRLLVEEGVVHSAKASTRPDAVDENVLDRLASSCFEELELGIQSFDDVVLDLSARGYTSAQAMDACRAVRASGLRLGIQLMPGLVGEDVVSFKTTVGKAASLAPDTARIYPTVVLAGTRLEDMFRLGAYTPLTLEEALRRTLYALIRLEGGGCTVLRMGLAPSQDLKVVAGPFHPAFGFLVRAEAYRLMATLAVERHGRGCTLVVNPRSACELVGYGRKTMQELTFAFECDDSVGRGEVWVKSGMTRSCIKHEDILEYIL